LRRTVLLVVDVAWHHGRAGMDAETAAMDGLVLATLIVGSALTLMILVASALAAQFLPALNR
jgi:hypothetical protein